MRPALLRCLVLLAVTPLSAQDLPVRRLVEASRVDATEHDLVGINFMAVSARGVVALGQPDDGGVRLIHPDGRVTAFGRSGEGPGEFRTPGRLGWLGDTLWIADPTLRRVTYVAPDGTLLRVTPLPREDQIAASSTTPMSVSIVIQYGAYPNGDLLLAPLLSVRSGRPSWIPAEHEGDTPMMRWPVDGRAPSIVGWNLAADLGPCVPGEAAGSGPRFSIPFCPRAAFAIDPAGEAAVNLLPNRDDPFRAPFRVIMAGPDGTTRYDRTVPVTPVRVPAEAIESLKARWRAVPNAPAALRERIDATRFPEYYGPFANVLLGEDLSTWIEHYTTDGTRRWQVLDPQGRPAFTVTAPSAVRLQLVSQTTAWGTEADADGLQHVVRYRVR